MKRSLYGISGLVEVNDAVKVVSGAPTTSTRGNIADIIVDKSTGYLYYLSNADAGVYTWIKYGTFTNDVDITGDFDVTGATSLTGDVTVVGDSDLTGALEVTGATTLTGDVGVTGDVSVTGDVQLGTANALSVTTGAVTDYAGTGTLVAGVLAIANTNIAATDLVFIQRVDANSSTAIGHLSYAIVADTSLTITSLDAAASTETNDVSNIAYFIIKTA